MADRFPLLSPEARRLMVKAVREQGYIPFGSSETSLPNKPGRYHAIYVRIGMWTPDIVHVPLGDEATLEEAWKQAQEFARLLEKEHQIALDRYISEIVGPQESEHQAGWPG